METHQIIRHQIVEILTLKGKVDKSDVRKVEEELRQNGHAPDIWLHFGLKKGMQLDREFITSILQLFDSYVQLGEKWSTFRVRVSASDKSLFGVYQGYQQSAIVKTFEELLFYIINTKSVRSRDTVKVINHFRKCHPLTTKNEKEILQTLLTRKNELKKLANSSMSLRFKGKQGVKWTEERSCAALSEIDINKITSVRQLRKHSSSFVCQYCRNAKFAEKCREIFAKHGGLLHDRSHFFQKKEYKISQIARENADISYETASAFYQWSSFNDTLAWNLAQCASEIFHQKDLTGEEYTSMPLAFGVIDRYEFWERLLLKELKLSLQELMNDYPLVFEKLNWRMNLQLIYPEIGLATQVFVDPEVDLPLSG